MVVYIETEDVYDVGIQNPDRNENASSRWRTGILNFSLFLYLNYPCVSELTRQRVPCTLVCTTMFLFHILILVQHFSSHPLSFHLTRIRTEFVLRVMRILSSFYLPFLDIFLLSSCVYLVNDFSWMCFEPALCDSLVLFI